MKRWALAAGRKPHRRRAGRLFGTVLREVYFGDSSIYLFEARFAEVAADSLDVDGGFFLTGFAFHIRYYGRPSFRLHDERHFLHAVMFHRDGANFLPHMIQIPVFGTDAEHCVPAKPAIAFCLFAMSLRYAQRPVSRVAELCRSGSLDLRGSTPHPGSKQSSGDIAEQW